MTSHPEEPVLQANPLRSLAPMQEGYILSAALGASTGCFDGVNGELYTNISQIALEVDTNPVFDCRNTIRGRGTTCCRVLSKDRVSCSIKDGWRHSKSKSGSALWKHAKGFGGIGQLFALEASMTTIAEDRTVEKMIPEAMRPASLRDLIFSDISLDGYGNTLQRFNSKLELTKAFRDALCGYRNLFQVGNILHRDISVSNVLIRKPGAQYPHRGVITDLDIATQSDRQSSLNDRMGTRTFQSLNILIPYFLPIKNVAPSNFMDDLESLFYVLCWVCASHSCPGVFVDQLPEYLILWGNISPNISVAAKTVMYRVELKKYLNLSDYYKGAVYNLLEGLFKIFKSRCDRNQYHYEDSEAEGIFQEILDLCKEAISDLEQQPEDTSSTADSQPSEKRPSTLSPDEERPIKHSRSGTREAPLA